MSRPSPLLAQALQFFSHGAYPQAINLLQQVAAAQPTLLEPRLQLAKACLDWVGILAGVPLPEVDPDTLSGEAAHYLQLASSQLLILEKTHPASPYVLGLLGIHHLIYNRTPEAKRCLKKALAKDPRNPDLLYNLGYALLLLDENEEAVVHFSRLTAFHPDHGRGWHMLGQAQRLAGDLEASLKSYRKAVSLLPDWKEPYAALALSLVSLARYKEAAEMLRSGLSLNPHIKGLNFDLASLALNTGDWETGWRYYLCRINQDVTDPFPAGYVVPLDKARPVRISFEQGMGDELFFLRFAPALRAQGYKIEYTTMPKLFPLLEGMPCCDTLKVKKAGEARDFDLKVGELPYVTGMRTTADIPPPLPLRADPEKIALLRRQLESFGPPPYLGLTWQAGTPPPEKSIKGDWHRKLFKQIPVQYLGELARDWPGSVVVLQRSPTEEDLKIFSQALGRPWLDWSHLNDDLTEALAGLSLLDEYVGVSNTNMHLLAGIGKVARVLLPIPEWRWMAEGKESPWFPGFKIYRKVYNSQLKWVPAMKELADDLKAKWGGRSMQK